MAGINTGENILYDGYDIPKRHLDYDRNNIKRWYETYTL